MKLGKFYVILFLLFFAKPDLILAQKFIVDPLLEKPWIPEAREEEKRSFHRFIYSSSETKKVNFNQDTFGRNYHVYPSMKVRYTIDNDYHREFPILGDADLALAEMEALIDFKKDLEAIFLGKGIELCQRLHERTEKTFSPPWGKEANMLLNHLLNKWSDLPEKVSLASEPYGCYEGDSEKIGSLYLESETFRYQMKIPSTLRYEGLFRKESGKIRHERDFVTRLVRFVEFISPSQGENYDDMAEAKLLQEARLTKKSPLKILFSIGTTFDYNPRQRTEKDYFKFWDKERGINSKTMLEKTFTRVADKDDYVSRWKSVDEIGNPSYYLMKEYYFYKSPIGIFLSLSFPESEKEKGESYWQMIRSELKVNEYK